MKDTLSQSAGRLIGRDPQYIERLWQDMNRAFFYPAGRERTDAIGALDLALWDIKGKVQGLPVHQLLGGMVRNYVRVLQHRRRHSGYHARDQPQGSCPAHHRSRLSRFPLRRLGGAGKRHLQHPRAHQPHARRMRPGARRRRQRWRLGASISTSASICPTPFAAATRSKISRPSSSKTRSVPKPF